MTARRRRGLTPEERTEPAPGGRAEPADEDREAPAEREAGEPGEPGQSGEAGEAGRSAGEPHPGSRTPRASRPEVPPRIPPPRIGEGLRSVRILPADEVASREPEARASRLRARGARADRDRADRDRADRYRATRERREPAGDTRGPEGEQRPHRETIRLSEESAAELRPLRRGGEMIRPAGGVPSPGEGPTGAGSLRAEEVRERILEATYACVARWGISKTTVEDAGRAAGVSRATVYRYFPGGRDELVETVIAWEYARFFTRLYEAVQDASSLEEVMERGLMFAHRAITEHEVLQRVLETEPEVLLPNLTVQAAPTIRLIGEFLVPYLLVHGVAPGVDPHEAAEFLARMVLSYIASPGRWDLDDPEQVARLVRAELLAGMVGRRPGVGSPGEGSPGEGSPGEVSPGEVSPGEGSPPEPGPERPDR